MYPHCFLLYPRSIPTNTNLLSSSIYPRLPSPPYTHPLQSLHFLFVLQEISSSQPSSRFAHLKRSLATIRVENSCVSVGATGLTSGAKQNAKTRQTSGTGREQNNGTGRNSETGQSTDSTNDSGAPGSAEETSDTSISSGSEVGDRVFYILLLHLHSHLVPSTYIHVSTSTSPLLFTHKNTYFRCIATIHSCPCSFFRSMSDCKGSL